MRGIHRSPVNSPHKGPVTQSFDVFFDLCLNKRLSKQSWGWWFKTLSSPFWRHCNVWYFFRKTSLEIITSLMEMMPQLIVTNVHAAGRHCKMIHYRKTQTADWTIRILHTQNIRRTENSAQASWKFCTVTHFNKNQVKSHISRRLISRFQQISTKFNIIAFYSMTIPYEFCCYHSLRETGLYFSSPVQNQFVILKTRMSIALMLSPFCFFFNMN